MTDDVPDTVPDWEDEYLDRVSDRLMFNYDLRKDDEVRGEPFDLVGELHVENRKQFLHQSIRYAEHDAREYVFARRTDDVTVADVDALRDLGEALADDWIDPSHDHYETSFTFVVVAPSVPANVRESVASHGGRSLLRYGYHGRYDVNVVVAAPEQSEIVASKHADVASAFTLWDEEDAASRGVVGRLLGRFR